MPSYAKICTEIRYSKEHYMSNDNQSQVILAVLRGNASSVDDICTITKLSKPTVDRIINKLNKESIDKTGKPCFILTSQ